MALRGLRSKVILGPSVIGPYASATKSFILFELYCKTCRLIIFLIYLLCFSARDPQEPGADPGFGFIWGQVERRKRHSIEGPQVPILG